jgi:hypothetical protein
LLHPNRDPVSGIRADGTIKCSLEKELRRSVPRCFIRTEILSLESVPMEP